jgi:regulator of protease activity HflC (stomatin/prohibitin superfamily)
MPMNGESRKIDMQAAQKILEGNAPWAVAACVVLLLLLLSTVRIGKVSGEQIGLLLNRISGKIEVIDQSGVRIYNGLVSEFYVLDRTLQTLEMTAEASRGDRAGRDDLKIKTMDGSDVHVDLKIQYRIIPELAREVILSSGPGDNYKQKWARDYMRSTCRNYLGELTTEEFYDSSKRDAQLVLALNTGNERLRPFGINIDSIVIPKRPQFYAEYEEMIKKKKLAD